MPPISSSETSKMESRLHAKSPLLKSLPMFWRQSRIFVPTLPIRWQRGFVTAPPLHDRHIGSLTVDDCTEVLRRLYAATPSSADRTRALMADVFSAAKVRGYRTGDNPCLWKGTLDQVLPRRPTLMRGHHAALGYASAPALFKALRSQGVVGRAAQFLMLTALRKMEAVGARWDEISGDVTSGANRGAVLRLAQSE